MFLVGVIAIFRLRCGISRSVVRLDVLTKRKSLGESLSMDGKADEPPPLSVLPIRLG